MVKTVEDYQKAGEEIFHKIHLATYPVGFKYIKNLETEIPAGVKRPIDAGMKLSICQAITLARQNGDKLCITAEDNFCTPSSAGHGWVPITKEEFVESQVRQGWSKDEEAERRRAEQIYAKNFEQVIAFGYRGVIIAPLHKTPVIPDSILIYGDGKQLTYLIHALTFEHKKKYAIRSNFEGFGESCAKGGLVPYLTGQIQIVISGAGDRSFAGIQDTEIGIGMLAKYLFYVLKNLFKVGGRQGLKFPLRQVLPMNLTENITPGFRYMREVFDKHLKNQSKE